MQKFGRKINLYRSLRTNMSMIACVGVYVLRSCLCVMWSLADPAYRLCVRSSIWLGTCIETLWYSEVGSKAPEQTKALFTVFYVFETKLLHLDQIVCVLFLAPPSTSRCSGHREMGKLCRCSSRYWFPVMLGYLELTLTPWKCPGWLQIPLISFDLILKDEGGTTNILP